MGIELFRGPQRAHTIVVSAGADTARDLAWELRRLADLIDREQLSVGCSGAPFGGSLYSYKHQPEMTHDAYFTAIDEWLASEAAKKEAPRDA